MAEIDLSPVDVLSQRIDASQLRQWEEERSLSQVENVCVQTYGQEPNEEGIQLGIGSKKGRSRGSIFSGRSSSQGPSRSSRASKNQHRHSADLVQATPGRCTPPKLDPYSSLSSTQTPFRIERGADVEWELLQKPFPMSNMDCETQISLSPRRLISRFVAEKAFHPRANPPGPLDRYLQQQEDMTSLGTNLERVEEEQRRIKLSRIDGLRLRTQLRDKRKDLQRKRLAKSAADDAFMKYVRESRSLPLPLSESFVLRDSNLDTIYEAMQTARDEYGEAEFAYNQLEDLVDEHEFDLAKLEGKFYNTEIEDIPYPSLSRESHPTAPESLLGISSDTPKEYHPFHVNYLTRLGDLDLVLERYHNMVEERDNLVLLQASRLPLGMELHKNGKDFLIDFPSQEARILGEILEIEEDVARWKEKCLAEGIEVSEESSGSQHESQDPESQRHRYGDQDTHSTHSASLETSMFPVLLPELVEDRSRLSVLITDFIEGRKSDCMNRWMQYQTRISPSEVALLERVFLHFLQIFSFSQLTI